MEARVRSPALGLPLPLKSPINASLTELVILDLRSTDDNPAVQGKLICRLSANVTTSTSTIGPRPTDPSSALASPPSNDHRRSINNESIYNESISNESIDNESIDNDNGSVYNTSVYTGSVKSASLELYSPTINTQNSHTISPEVTPIMTISTTLAPLEQLQSLPNIPIRPVISDGTSTADHPDHPQRPSAPAPPEQPITNGQHNLNVNEDQYGPLPEGWESGVDLLGLTYYVNRHAHSITRTRPSPNQAVDQKAETTTTGSGSLPAGWEERDTSDGQVNDITHSTTRVDPRLQTTIRLKGSNGWDSLRPQAILQLGPLPSGWEMRLTRTNRLYFINKSTQTTTWDDPRLPWLLYGDTLHCESNFRRKYCHFRRQPKLAYWKTKLSDNGLCLENVHIKYVFYSP